MSRKDKKEWDLADLLSVIGFVFELLRVVVNALRKRGGTIEHLRRLLKESDLVDQVFDLIVVKPVEVVKRVLFCVDTAITTVAKEKFVARDSFVLDTSGRSRVKLVWMSNNFELMFLSKVERECEAFRLARYTLTTKATDYIVIAELGGKEKVRTTLCAIWQLLMAQGIGEAGPLLTNGFANNFYVEDRDGALRVVSAIWYNDGWGMAMRSVSTPTPWMAGVSFFSPKV